MRILLIVTAIIFTTFPAMAQITYVGTAFQITTGLTSTGGQHKPRVAYDGIDTYLAVWEQGSNVHSREVKQVYAARVQMQSGVPTVLDANGIALSASAYAQELPRVVYGGGKWLVAWQQFNGTDYDIRGVTVTNTTSSAMTASRAMRSSLLNVITR